MFYHFLSIYSWLFTQIYKAVSLSLKGEITCCQLEHLFFHYLLLLVPFTPLKKKTCVFNIPKWAYHWSDCFAHSRWINFHLLFPNSLKLRRTCFGYVVHNDIPPSSHSTKALNLVTPSSIEILWQLVIKWENGPGSVLGRRFLLNLALLMKHSLCYLYSVLRWGICYCKTWQDVQIMIIL